MIRRRLLAVVFWSLLIGGVFLGVQWLVVSAYLYFASRGPSATDMQQGYEELIIGGDLLAMATVVSGFVGVLLTLLATRLLVGRSSIRHHLGLRAVRGTLLLKWCLGFIVMLMVLEGLTAFSEAPTTPDVMVEVYQSADSKLLLLFAVVVVASLFEELFFRGFLLEGLRSSLGGAASVLLSAGLWSVVHVQYDMFGIASIFIIGVFLGIARLRTGSTLLPMILHGLNNAIAFSALAYLSA